MSIDKLISHFKNTFPLTNKEKEELSLLFIERKIKRRGYILQKGDVSRHFTFVVSGCFKMYVVDQIGKEHNLEFAIENDWINDLSSFYSEKPANVYIEAIEPSTILQIGHEDVIDLYSKYPRLNSSFRVIIERKYIELQNRTLQNISATAEDKYKYFLQKHPTLAKRLPNTQIASYLGITPEFLSKIRKYLVQKR